MFLNKQQQYTVHFYSLLLFCFLMPIYPWFATPFISLATLNWLLSGGFQYKIKRLTNPLAIIFSSVYLIHLIGLLYTSNLVEGLQDIETKLTLFLFPLLLFSVPFKDYLSEKRQFLKAFIIGSFIACVICLIANAYTYFAIGVNNFKYPFLGKFLSAHPGYQSMYGVFSIIIMIHYSFFSDETPLFNKILSLFLGSFFILLTMTFGSRAIILAMILIFLFTTLIIGYKKVGMSKAIGITGITCLAMVGVLLLVPAYRERMNIFDNNYQPIGVKKSPIDPRVIIWENSLEAIKTNPIIGTGTGDIQDHLLTFHKKSDYDLAIIGNFNAHNQFLQTTIALGIIGLIILLLNFGVPIILGFKHKDYLLLMFLFLFLFFSLTESALEKQQGVLFYAFFNSLLCIGLLGGRSR